MEETDQSPASNSSASSSPQDNLQPSTHRSRHAKVYDFFGFNCAYNFLLCKCIPSFAGHLESPTLAYHHAPS